MSFENRKWVIINKNEVSSVDFSKVLQRSADTLRWNENKSKTFVKYEGNKPSFLSGKDVLNHSEMLEELKKDEWIAGDPV